MAQATTAQAKVEPPKIADAVQMWSRYIYPSMAARLVQGGKIKEVMDWASQELEGFRRG